jgi:RNA polymerase sigma-70 factor (ECF subfamily)
MMSAAITVREGGVGDQSEVARLRRGDLNALSSLLAQYQNRLYRYLLQLVRDRANAEDLFQQTWIRVAERIQQYDPSRSFEAWLFTVARNLGYDHLRRTQPESLDQRMESNPSGTLAQRSLVAPEQGALQRLLERERATLLATALDELPVMYREVLTLRFEEEMKIHEIAVLLEVPLSTVKTRLRRGLDGLREVLSGTGLDEERGKGRVQG